MLEKLTLDQLKLKHFNAAKFTIDQDDRDFFDEYRSKPRIN